jgi:predicted nucleic acid-binding protein
MTKKILVNSDAILDLLAERTPFYDNVAKIFTLAYGNKIELYTTPAILANVFYILRKSIGNSKSKERLKDLRLLVKILPVNEHIVDEALASDFSDFEDALEYFTAEKNTMLGIITKNPKNYRIRNNDMVIQTSEEFIKMNPELFKKEERNNN